MSSYTVPLGQSLQFDTNGNPRPPGATYAKTAGTQPTQTVASVAQGTQNATTPANAAAQAPSPMPALPKVAAPPVTQPPPATSSTPAPASTFAPYTGTAKIWAAGATSGANPTPDANGKVQASSPGMTSGYNADGNLVPVGTAWSTSTAAAPVATTASVPPPAAPNPIDIAFPRLPDGPVSSTQGTSYNPITGQWQPGQYSGPKPGPGQTVNSAGQIVPITANLNLPTNIGIADSGGAFSNNSLPGAAGNTAQQSASPPPAKPLYTVPSGQSLLYGLDGAPRTPTNPGTGATYTGPAPAGMTFNAQNQLVPISANLVAPVLQQTSGVNQLDSGNNAIVQGGATPVLQGTPNPGTVGPPGTYGIQGGATGNSQVGNQNAPWSGTGPPIQPLVTPQAMNAVADPNDPTGIKALIAKTGGTGIPTAPIDKATQDALGITNTNTALAHDADPSKPIASGQLNTPATSAAPVGHYAGVSPQAYAGVTINGQTYSVNPGGGYTLIPQPAGTAPALQNGHGDVKLDHGLYTYADGTVIGPIAPVAPPGQAAPLINGAQVSDNSVFGQVGRAIGDTAQQISQIGVGGTNVGNILNQIGTNGVTTNFGSGVTPGSSATPGIQPIVYPAITPPVIGPSIIQSGPSNNGQGSVAPPGFTKDASGNNVPMADGAVGQAFVPIVPAATAGSPPNTAPGAATSIDLPGNGGGVTDTTPPVLPPATIPPSSNSTATGHGAVVPDTTTPGSNNGGVFTGPAPNSDPNKPKGNTTASNDDTSITQPVNTPVTPTGAAPAGTLVKPGTGGYQDLVLPTIALPTSSNPYAGVNPYTGYDPYLNQDPTKNSYQSTLAGQGVSNASNNQALAEKAIRQQAASRGLTNAGESGIEAQMQANNIQQGAQARTQAENDANVQATKLGADWQLAQAQGTQGYNTQQFNQAVTGAQLPGALASQNISNSTANANLTTIKNNWDGIQAKVASGINLSLAETQFMQGLANNPVLAASMGILPSMLSGLGTVAGTAGGAAALGGIGSAVASGVGSVGSFLAGLAPLAL